jgi:hypothetical protein
MTRTDGQSRHSKVEPVGEGRIRPSQAPLGSRVQKILARYLPLTRIDVSGVGHLAPLIRRPPYATVFSARAA